MCIYILCNIIYIYLDSPIALFFQAGTKKNAKDLFTILCTFFRFGGISKVHCRLQALHHLNIPLLITIILISHYYHLNIPLPISIILISHYYHLNIPLPITIILISRYHHEPNHQHPEALVWIKSWNAALGAASTSPGDKLR